MDHPDSQRTEPKLCPFCSFPVVSCKEKKQTSAKSGKAVFIILDGIPADVIEKVDPPTLTDIAAEGDYTRAYVGGVKDAYSETPTISAVGYNSLLTGTWVNKHNVWATA